ncbi:MAG: porin family protein [Devosia sp.]|uniref:outer membrane protein n=1 Tax=Devosia sp. TaxID=1871048 RepID=UPI001AC50A1F|nr:outer membrane beta-barrel protein [Devosia sp.]MBN9317167.1 porin family protein [Devosia sp.]
MRFTKTIFVASAMAAGLSSGAFAADLIVDEPAPAVGVVDMGGNWDGPYVGVFAGAGWGLADHTNGGGGPCGSDDEGCDLDLSGWLLGVTAGANFTVGGSFVLGVAGDIAWSNVSGTDYFGPIIGDAENTINWEGSIRGVAGWDAGAFMPYLTAGLAFANASHYSDFANETADATHMGWTAGVGVAVSVAENISLDLQYRHSWYDEQEYDVGAGPFNPVFGLQTDRITAGMNFHF